MTLAKVAFAGVLLSLVTALIAAVHVWRHGGSGGARIVVSLAIGLGILAWPLTLLRDVQRLPMINDITTDTLSPTELTALADVRSAAGRAGGSPRRGPSGGR